MHFALLRNPVSTVPMYADEPGLLVFGASLTSDSLSKNKFCDRLRAADTRPLLFLFIPDVPSAPGSAGQTPKPHPCPASPAPSFLPGRRIPERAHRRS